MEKKGKAKKNIETKEITREVNGSIENKKSIKVDKNSSDPINKDKRDKQSLILLGSFLGIILIFVLIFIFARGSNTFTFQGTQFTKSNQNSVIFYTAKVPTLDANGNVASFTTIDFRSDPRTLNNIPVETNGIQFVRRKSVYLSYGDLNICKYNGLVALNLNMFLSTFGVNNRMGALANKTYAEEVNMTYANCETNPDNTVILIKNGDKTMINQTSANCYEIISKDCEILGAVEKFELEMLKEYIASLN